MEIIKTEKIESNNVNELVKAFNNFVEELKETMESKTYQGEPIYRFTTEPKEINISNLKELGIRDIKRFKRYLNKAILYKSEKSINRLFNLVYKRFLKLENIPRFVCDKHEIIQKLRKEWKIQQKIANQMLKQYKLEKGNFYKTIKV